jgi:hypothetical protein
MREGWAGRPFLVARGKAYAVAESATRMMRVPDRHPAIASQCYDVARGRGHGRWAESLARPLGRCCDVALRRTQPPSWAATSIRPAAGLGTSVEAGRGSRHTWAGVASLRDCGFFIKREPQVPAAGRGPPRWSGTTPGAGLDHPCGGYRSISRRPTLPVTDAPDTQGRFSMCSDQPLRPTGRPGPRYRPAFCASCRTPRLPEYPVPPPVRRTHGLSGGGRP